MFDVSEFHLVPSTKYLMVMTQGSHPVWSFDISFKCFKINLSGKICCNKCRKHIKKSTVMAHKKIT